MKTRIQIQHIHSKKCKNYHRAQKHITTSVLKYEIIKNDLKLRKLDYIMFIQYLKPRSHLK